MKRGVFVYAVAAALWASRAHADPRAEIGTAPPPRTPAPFILPELAHDRTDVQLDWFYGSLATNPGTLRSNAPVALMSAAGETSVLPRRLYLGLAYPVGFSMPPDGGLAAGEDGPAAGSRALPGNLSAHVRAIFPLPTFLEIGFLLGVVAPTAAFDRDARGNRSAAFAIGTLDPTTYLDFLPGRIALRPAGDLRIRRGPLLFQGRHGMDVIIDGNGVEPVMLAGRLLMHLGYEISPSLEFSLEAQQYYFFTANPTLTPITTPAQAFNETYRIKDGNRSSLTFGPSLRAATKHFDYGVAFMTNIADPLSPVVDRMLGMRFSVIAHMPNHKD